MLRVAQACSSRPGLLGPAPWQVQWGRAVSSNILRVVVVAGAGAESRVVGAAACRRGHGRFSLTSTVGEEVSKRCRPPSSVGIPLLHGSLQMHVINFWISFMSSSVSSSHLVWPLSEAQSRGAPGELDAGDCMVPQSAICSRRQGTAVHQSCPTPTTATTTTTTTTTKK